MSSNANNHLLSYVVEDTIGTTPTNPRFTRLPDTKTSIALTRDTLESTRITGDRFMAPPRLGAKGVSGDLPIQLSYGAYDDFLASALQGEWVEAGGTDSIDIEVDSIPNAGEEEGGTFVTTNGTVTIERIDAKRQEVILKYDEAGAISTYPLYGLDSATIDGELFEITAYTDAAEDATILAGDTRKSMTLLREFSDFAPGKKPFLMFSGVEVTTWNLTAAANGIVESTFGLFGQDSLAPAEDAPTGTSYSPAIDTEFYDTFSGDVKIDGVSLCEISEFNLTLDNGFNPRYAVGCPNSGDPSIGDSNLTGSFTAYLEDEKYLEKFYNEEGLTLELTFLDPTGSGIVVTLPNLKILTGTQADVGDDPDIFIPVNFSAHKDDALGSHISIQRISPVSV